MMHFMLGMASVCVTWFIVDYFRGRVVVEGHCQFCSHHEAREMSVILCKGCAETIGSRELT